MVQVQHVSFNNRRCIHIFDYSIPSEVRDLYNAKNTISLLVTLDPTPLLYVPMWLRCRRGNPIHLNQHAPPDLEALGWKWACWETCWNEKTHTTASLLNLIDEYFTGYPNSM
jgi:hypothetical protein